MKKFLSFTLVAIMLLSVLMLTSCDISDTIKSFVDNIIGNEEPRDEVRTTITAVELRHMYQITNHTTNANLGDVKLNVVAADTLMKMDLYTLGGGTTTTYYDQKASTIITKDLSLGWIGYLSDTVSVVGNTKLCDLGLLPEVTLEEITYNEETKSYTYEEDETKMTLKFEDGKLVYAFVELGDSGSDGKIEITNVGKTEVQIPDHFVINDGKPDKHKVDKGVVTTITDEDLKNLLDMQSFTFKGKIMTDSGVSADVAIKMNDTGIEVSTLVLGTYEKQYIMLIDGYLYTVSKDENGKYSALNMGLSMVDFSEQFNSFKENIVMDIPYDVLGKYYRVESEGIGMYLYFEDGQLTKAIMIMDSALVDPSHMLTTKNKIEISFVLTDVDKTKIYFPKYEIPKEEVEFEFNSDGTGYIVTGIGGYKYFNKTEIIIPETYNGLPVVEIGEEAFRNCDFMTSIDIPETVKKIGIRAFYGCDNLKEIVIPDGVIEIGDTAFFECKSLTFAVIGNSVVDMGRYTFKDCTALESVIFGSSLETIGYLSFEGCKSLKSIIIPENVTTIDSNAFAYCYSLETVILGSSLKEIGSSAFYGCISLKSIVIPKSVKVILYNAFSSCTSLTIYCEAESKPESWYDSWNPLDRPVVWGYTGE